LGRKLVQRIDGRARRDFNHGFNTLKNYLDTGERRIIGIGRVGTAAPGGWNLFHD